MASLLPEIDPNDAADTRWAIQTASTLWHQGERREALQWIRRAAEAAAEAGQDGRSLSLAKSGAELRTALEIPRTLPPPPPAPEDAAVQKSQAARPDGELVVTVVATDRSIPAPNASLVSHRAARVAVLPGADPSELRVRVLAPGEVASREATVALLVALEPGISPVPPR